MTNEPIRVNVKRPPGETKTYPQVNAYLGLPKAQGRTYLADEADGTPGGIHAVHRYYKTQSDLFWPSRVARPELDFLYMAFDWGLGRLRIRTQVLPKDSVVLTRLQEDEENRAVCCWSPALNSILWLVERNVEWLIEGPHVQGHRPRYALGDPIPPKKWAQIGYWGPDGARGFRPAPAEGG